MQSSTSYIPCNVKVACRIAALSSTLMYRCTTLAPSLRLPVTCAFEINLRLASGLSEAAPQSTGKAEISHLASHKHLIPDKCSSWCQITLPDLFADRSAPSRHSAVPWSQQKSPRASGHRRVVRQSSRHYNGIRDDYRFIQHYQLARKEQVRISPPMTRHSPVMQKSYCPALH